MPVLWLLASMVTPAAAQSTDGVSLEQAAAPASTVPSAGVTDKAGLARLNPALVARMREAIHKLEDEHGFSLHLILESVLVSGSVQREASRLQKEWQPAGDGMVIVYEMDTKALGLGHGSTREIEPDKAPPGQVPAFVLMEIISKAGEIQRKSLTSEEYIGQVVTSLTKNIEAYFLRKAAPPPEGRSVRLSLILIGGAAALALAGLAGAWLLKRSEGGDTRSYFFPETEIPERLAAPYGGGKVSCRRFGTDAPPRP